MKLLSPVLLLLLTLPLKGYAEVYKSVDENGNVTYSQTKPKDSDNVETIKTPKFKPAPPPPTTKPVAASTSADPKPEDAENKQADSEEQQQVDAENAEIKKQNCENSKSRYKQLSEAGRVKITGEDGNLKWASEEEIKSRLDELKANVDKWCN